MIKEIIYTRSKDCTALSDELGISMDAGYLTHIAQNKNFDDYRLALVMVNLTENEVKAITNIVNAMLVELI